MLLWENYKAQLSHPHLLVQEMGWRTAVNQTPERKPKAAGRPALGPLLKAGLTDSSQDQAFISLGSPPPLNHKSNKNFQYVPLPCLISCSSCQSSAPSWGSPKSLFQPWKQHWPPRLHQTMKAAPVGSLYVPVDLIDHSQAPRSHQNSLAHGPLPPSSKPVRKAESFSHFKFLCTPLLFYLFPVSSQRKFCF